MGLFDCFKIKDRVALIEMNAKENQENKEGRYYWGLNYGFMGDPIGFWIRDESSLNRIEINFNAVTAAKKALAEHEEHKALQYELWRTRYGVKSKPQGVEVHEDDARTDGTNDKM